MPRIALFVALAVVLAGARAVAQDKAPIYITEGKGKRYRAAVQRFRPQDPAAGRLVEEIRLDIEAGLAFSGLFESIRTEAFLESVDSPPLANKSVACPSWAQIGSDALVQGEVGAATGQVRAEFRVFDVSRGCLRMLRKVYRVDRKDRGRLGARIADDVVGAFTGMPGVADTEIAFVSDRRGAKEIHVMDADGGSLRRATNNSSINLFPSWSPAGDAILYTSYRKRNRPALFLLTRGRKSPGQILGKLKGMAPYRGVYHPTKDYIALVKSVDGATEIFTGGVDGRGVRRLTNTRAIEVGPSWSPDGGQLAFVSDRAGAPQIYTMNADGSGQRRITYNGGYNANPAWSPDGKWIAYESRVGGQMDIWLIDPSGQVNVPLVQHPRSDEHPAWSPDGRMLAFSSSRRGSADIFIVDANGENLRAVTAGGGEDRNPAWGPRRLN